MAGIVVPSMNCGDTASGSMQHSVYTPNMAGGGLASAEASSRLASRALARARRARPQQAGGSSLLYALHVTPGHERSMLTRVSRISGDSLSDIFRLSVEFERRRAGQWARELEPLYPGYLFLEVADMAAFERQLTISTEYARLLRVGRDAAPLRPEEALVVSGLGGREHVVRMSSGVVEDGRLRVVAGPLAGNEQLVSRVDRHKRKAWLSCGLECAGVTRVGLSIASKT